MIFRKYINIVIFLTLLAYADINNSFKSSISSNLFLLNNDLFKSGKYTVYNSEKSTITNHSVLLNYPIKSINDINPFLLAGLGISTLENRNGKIDSKYIKLGGGISFNLSDINLKLGATNLWQFGDLSGDYKKELSNSTKNQIRDFFIKTKYKKEFDNATTLSTYLTLHFQDIKYDYNIKSINGFSGDLKLEYLKKNVTTIYKMPVSTKVYISTTLIDNRLKSVMGYNNLTTLGGNVYLNVGKYTPFYKDKLKNLNLNFNAQVTKGSNDFKGYKLGVGVKLLKY